MTQIFVRIVTFVVVTTALVPTSVAASSGETTAAQAVSPTERLEDSFIFFNPDGIGAHAFYTPWSMILESGFEEYGSKSLSKLDLARGQSNVIKAYPRAYRYDSTLRRRQLSLSTALAHRSTHRRAAILSSQLSVAPDWWWFSFPTYE